ncbi:MAG: DNA mismatch repair protein MutS [Clostridia bacterium]|nr:DNA mismatch repair protein MutS [Clostridia bacterium]
MKIERYDSFIEADIHNMYSDDAKKALERLITDANDDVTQIIVIHGYREGTALQNMVRIKLKHRRIDRKILTMNKGQTILLLKKK